MKKLAIFCILLLIWQYAVSQTKFGNEWVTSLGYKFNFNTSPLTHDTFFNNSIGFNKGASCISDSSGYIVIQCNGSRLVNRNSVLIENGDSIIHDLYSASIQGMSKIPQSSLILPMANKKYYVFTPTVSDSYYVHVWLSNPVYNWNSDQLLYHVVDLNQNGGLGKVVEKKKPLLQHTRLKLTMMAACRHANGKDWWLLKMAGDSNMVYTFLVKQDTILRYPNQGIPFPFRGSNDAWGQMKFSNDGTKWALTYDARSDTVYTPSCDVMLAQFDRCTGRLGGFQHFHKPGESGFLGLEFSPNGNYIYATRYSEIHQLDLSEGTWYNVYGEDTNFFCGYTTLQLAPDDKIYISRFDGICKQISYINNPDGKGWSCQFCPNCLRSQSNWGFFNGVPNVANYELGSTGQPCWPLDVGELVIEKAQLEIYPNPFIDEVNIAYQLATGEDASLVLYDVLGKEIYRKVLPANQYFQRINLKSIASGFYVYRISTASGELYIGKLQKQ